MFGPYSRSETTSADSAATKSASQSTKWMNRAERDSTEGREVCRERSNFVDLNAGRAAAPNIACIETGSRSPDR